MTTSKLQTLLEIHQPLYHLNVKKTNFWIKRMTTALKE